MRSTPVLGAGRGGGGGASACEGGERTLGSDGALFEEARSWKVRRVARMVISKPLRSAISNLLNVEVYNYKLPT